MPKVSIKGVGVVTVKQEDLPALQDYLAPEKKIAKEQSAAVISIGGEIKELVDQNKQLVANNKKDSESTQKALKGIVSAVKGIKIESPAVTVESPKIDVQAPPAAASPDVEVIIPKASRVKVENFERTDDRITSCEVVVMEWAEYEVTD